MAEANTTTYSDMLIKEKIAPMLNLEPTGPWDVVSETDTGLVMVHARSDADMNYYSALRGVCVDTNKGNVVAYSYPHSPQIVTSSFSLTDGKIFLGDREFSPDKIRIKPGFEGPLIHVFKHGNKVYRSTRKRFDPSKSRWGNSITFEEMYQQLGGPGDEELFDPEKSYSPYCHTFILVHPQMLVCTKNDVQEGYMVYLGPKKMYSTEESCPYPVEEVDPILRVPKTTSEVETGKIYSPQLMTLEEANKHLLFGFYDGFEGYEYLDPRLLPGEFVILEDMITGNMFRVESPSYHWRSEMRNNNPNILHRFFELLDYSYLKNTEEDMQKYVERFPVLTFFDVESLTSTVHMKPMVVWPQDTEKDLFVPTTREAKLYNIWQCLLISMPLCRQVEIVTYYNYLCARKNEVVDWLIELSEQKVDPTLFSKRVNDILTKTRKFAEDSVRKGNNFDRKTRKKKNADEITRDNIRNFINKEMGNSLYRILREMDRYKNPVVNEM